MFQLAPSVSDTTFFFLLGCRYTQAHVRLQAHTRTEIHIYRIKNQSFLVTVRYCIFWHEEKIHIPCPLGAGVHTVDW